MTDDRVTDAVAADGEPLATPAAGDGLPLPRRYLAIAAMSFGSALVALDAGVANVALPTIAHDLGIARSAAVSVVTVYQLTLVMLLLPLAGLGERVGLKRTYQAGQALFTVATALCFFAKSLPFLLIVRAAQAIGAAGVLSVASALVRQIYPRAQLGKGLALNAVCVTGSAAAAPTIGGFILAVAPWPWVFASAVPFAVLSLLFGRAIPDPAPRQARFDLPGALLSAATFGLVIGGLEALVHGDSPVVAGAVTLTGLAIGVALVRRELRVDAPILPVDLLMRPVLALSAAGGFLAFTASMTLIISTPFRLQALGFGVTQIGACIAPWPLTNVIVAPLAGYLSDRIPAGLLGGLGMAVSIVALVLIGTMPAHPDWFDVAWRMALCGSGFGLYLPPNARLLVGSAPRARAAAAGSLVSTVRLTGQTTGATLVAALLALGVGAGRTPAFVAAGFALVAGLLSVARLRPSVREPDAVETATDVPVLKQAR